jgi:CheY-like chemotaxis protein
MANILLLDPDNVAKKAMHGIVARGSHRLATVDTVREAWDFIQRNVVVDIVFVELKLRDENALALVERMRKDCFLQLVPVVVYTVSGDREAVRRATSLKVQNFLVKPYSDSLLLGEVNKALANPWRARHFEEEHSFCVMMGYTPEFLHKKLDELKTTLAASTPALLEQVKMSNVPGIVARLAELSAAAEAAGAWGIVELLANLNTMAEQGHWPSFTDTLNLTVFAGRMIEAQLNPDTIPEDFISDDERSRDREAAERARWFKAPAENRCPVVEWPQLALELDALKGCPVIDSVAASFQMCATGHPSSLSPLMDLAEKDPALCAHLLVAANLLRSPDDLDPEPIDNPRNCVSMLGELKLAAMARSLSTSEERMMNVPPCTWTSFWTFQVGVARMARYTCQYLEFQSLESRAYAAGLMHDLGQLLLLHLHPIGFQATLDFSRRENVPLEVAQQKFFSATTREMGAHFALGHGLLPSYAQVMRWVAEPAQAPADQVLVAIVSLARDICRLNRFGWCGDLASSTPPPIAETAGWEVLSQRVFPSFNLTKFVAEANAECREIKREILGQLSTARA